MEHISWDMHTAVLEEALSGGGVFLVALDKHGRPNPMTIGWAQVGIIWSRPMLTVLVRKSRYTYSCLLESSEFTVNVPPPGGMSNELTYCGTKSGRDVDKVASCHFTMGSGQRVSTPIIAECSQHYECQIVLRKQLSGEDFSAPRLLDEYYEDDDHHMIVIGEIKAAYTD